MVNKHSQIDRKIFSSDCLNTLYISYDLIFMYTSLISLKNGIDIYPLRF